MGGFWDVLKDTGKELAFTAAVEYYKPKIIEGLRDWLKAYSKDELKAMIIRGELPQIPPDVFAEAHGWADYIVKIPIEEVFMELLVPARPEVVQIIQETGQAGSDYIAKLYYYLIDCVKDPEGAQVAASGPKAKIVDVTCSECKKSFPIAEDKVKTLTECPLCHTSFK